MISLEVLYSLIEGNYAFLIACDPQEKLRYCSHDLKKNLGLPLTFAMDTTLKDILDPSSLTSFRQAIETVEQGNCGVNALLSSKNPTATSRPLHVQMVEIPHDHLYLFFGSQLGTLNPISDGRRDERVKELNCLYDVTEWIENSSSLEEFFAQLPKYLAPGMRFPEEVVVYSIYGENSYGQKPTTDDYLVTYLKVKGALKGEICIGYLRNSHKLLPEEQKMLSQIGCLLNLAIECKELSIGMAIKQEEAAEFERKLAQIDKQFSAREGDQDRQQLKLSTVDSHLTRISSNYEKAHRRVETMFQAIPSPVMQIDLNFNIVMSNQEKLEAGQKCYAAFFNRAAPCSGCCLTRAMKLRAPVTSTIRHEDRHLQLQTLPVFNEQREVDGVIEFIRDVTLEKTYEQQIQQANQLASLGQLVSGIGHEINNPNQFIRGNVKIVRQALDDLLPIADVHYQNHPDLKVAKLEYSFFKDHIMTLVDDMAHGSERIKGIVDGLRSFARKNEGLLIDMVDVNTSMGATTRLIQNEVHKRANIELDLAPDLPSFTGNSQKIEQVLINLIVNAAQAIPDDVRGEVRVSTRFEDGQVVIRVQDNGKGMDTKTLKQIFDPFFTTKRTKGGTGLGLAICFRIIEEHGGTIAVTSALNQGTTFTVSLPVKTAEKS